MKIVGGFWWHDHESLTCSPPLFHPKFSKFLEKFCNACKKSIGILKCSFRGKSAKYTYYPGNTIITCHLPSFWVGSQRTRGYSFIMFCRSSGCRSPGKVVPFPLSQPLKVSLGLLHSPLLRKVWEHLLSSFQIGALSHAWPLRALEC